MQEMQNVSSRHLFRNLEKLARAQTKYSVYEGASLMSGRLGGVQRLLQRELGREFPHVQRFNQQLHEVLVHAMFCERAIEDLFSICNVLWEFTRKPTTAAR